MEHQKTANNKNPSIFFAEIVLISMLVLSSCTTTKHINSVQTLKNAHLQTVHTLDVYVENDTIHTLVSGIDLASQQLSVNYIASSDAGKTWSEPSNVNHNIAPVKKSKRGNDFQLAAYGEKVMAVWQTKGGEPWTGKISVALSTDNGENWKKISSPVDERYAKIDQGYFDISADSAGYFHLVWLDDREEAGNTQGLHYARFNVTADEDQWERHSILETTACTCCWTRIISDNKGNIQVLFRNDEPRDMMIISSLNNGKSWQAAKPVEAFNWSFVGCPHQGGGLTSTINNDSLIVHNLIWNGNTSNRGLYYKQTGLMANKLPAAILVGDNSSASGDIAAIDNQRIAMVYTRGTFDSKHVMAKISDDGGQSWSEEYQLTRDGAEPSHPRVVGTKEGFRFFWTEWQQNGDAVVVMSKIN